MKVTMIHSLATVAGLCIVMATLLTLAATANAQCGGTYESITSAIALSKGQSSLIKQPVQSLKSFQDAMAGDKAPVNTSIVGLWRIKFIIDTPGGPTTFQEAFQIWNTGGTEVHNPKVDPRTGSVCLGSWVQQAPLTFNLTHRVWLYNTAGQFQVLAHLTESLTLGNRGNTHSGTFALQAVDDNDNPLGDPLTGMVVGERITPN
jgi:hypothetical protein